MIKCGVCGNEFEESADLHYVVRDDDPDTRGFLECSGEKTLYDAFDCPKCGCQHIAQERKRTFKILIK